MPIKYTKSDFTKNKAGYIQKGNNKERKLRNHVKGDILLTNIDTIVLTLRIQ